MRKRNENLVLVKMRRSKGLQKHHWPNRRLPWVNRPELFFVSFITVQESFLHTHTCFVSVLCVCVLSSL